MNLPKLLKESYNIYLDSLIKTRRLSNPSETRMVIREAYSFYLGQKMASTAIEKGSVSGTNTFGNYDTLEMANYITKANIILDLAYGLRRASLKTLNRGKVPKGFTPNQGRYHLLKSVLISWMAEENRQAGKNWAIDEFMAIKKGERDDAL